MRVNICVCVMINVTHMLTMLCLHGMYASDSQCNRERVRHEEARRQRWEQVPAQVTEQTSCQPIDAYYCIVSSGKEFLREVLGRKTHRKDVAAL
jgi:hypothetical protein